MTNGNVLFLLAGYRGAGKTTLLANSLKQNLPIFGKEYDIFFQKTKFPCKLPEYLMTLEEALACKSWVTWNHIYPLSLLKCQPNHIVLHLDFISLLLLTNIPQDKTSSQVITYLCEKKNMENLMTILIDWLSQSLLNKYDHILINTLFTPWRSIEERVKERNYPDSSISGLLFNSSGHGEKIHGLFYETWFEKVDLIKPELNLISKFHNSKLRNVHVIT